MTHLAHRLPWDILHELMVAKPFPRPPNAQRLTLTNAQEKKLRHFARCLGTAIQEFAATDKSTPEERKPFDPTQWPYQIPHGRGGHLGYYDSLVAGYVQLNLILMDPIKCAPRLFENGPSWAFSILLGHCDGGHPDHLASHLQPVMEDHTSLRPLTAEVLQVLRDHAAMLFRCMYSIPGDNDLLQEETVFRTLEWVLM